MSENVKNVSDDKDVNVEDVKPSDAEADDVKKKSPGKRVSITEKLRKEVEDLKAVVEEKEDTALRAVAELDNFRRRMTKETDDKIKFSNQTLLLSLLPVLDNLDSAIASFKDDEPSSTKDGVELIRKSFCDTVAKFGLLTIEVNIGDKFDPNNHEAVLLDNDSDMENDAITLVLQKGYILNERVIRPSKVKVNKISQ